MTKPAESMTEAERLAEIAALTRQQDRDDRPYQDSQIVGYDRTLPLYEQANAFADPTLDPAYIYERDNETTDPSSPEARAEAVLAALPPELYEVYLLLYGERLSQREAAQMLGVDRQVIRTRERKLRETAALLMAGAYGS